MRARTLLCLGCFILAIACRKPNVPPALSFHCDNFPTLTPDVPGDLDLPNHPNVQCFAWQEFIALNWPARSDAPGEPDRLLRAASFGLPRSAGPAVWETYKEAHDVFLPDGGEPSAWGAAGPLRSLSASFKSRALVPLQAQAQGFHVFRMTSKVSPAAPRLRRIFQADGGWLTAQNGRLTHYGIHMNRPEFEYILGERLFDAREQADRFISLPAGRTGRGAAGPAEGAIEVKSAWVEITERRLEKRFWTARACILEDEGCRMATVGLVGIHILHKTETFPQWSWATFEHVDNAPDRENLRQGTLARHYTYFNRRCPTVDPACVANAVPTGPLTRPVQVVRETPLAASTRELNRLVHERIRAANRRSVWQYYDLVDVQWPEVGTPVTGPQDVPLPQGGPTPTVLANSVIETYVQRTSTCLDCHASATIACSSRAIGSLRAADYSFLFAMAKEPTPPPECR